VSQGQKKVRKKGEKLRKGLLLPKKPLYYNPLLKKTNLLVYKIFLKNSRKSLTKDDKSRILKGCK